MALQSITLAAGCFWCTEAVYEQVEGVISVESGYSNGHTLQPSYEQVCSGRTGHAEVVRVEFDDQRIGLREVLEIFFSMHDPTTLDRQGNDVGEQYRSGIYLHDEAQRAVAQQVLDEAQAAYGGRVVTELMPLQNYSRAENYHQHFFGKNPGQGYCAAVSRPRWKNSARPSSRT